MGSTPTLQKSPVSTAVEGGDCSSTAAPQAWCLSTLANAVPGVESLEPHQTRLRPGLGRPPPPASSLLLLSLGAAGGLSVLSLTRPLLSFLASFLSLLGSRFT